MARALFFSMVLRTFPEITNNRGWGKGGGEGKLILHF